MNNQTALSSGISHEDRTMKTICPWISEPKRFVSDPNVSLHAAKLFAAVALVALTGCSTGLRIQSAHVPPGSLRLAQVVMTGTGQEVKSPTAQPLHAILTNSGINDAEIKDDSVVLARIECCGGPNEESSAIMM